MKNAIACLLVAASILPGAACAGGQQQKRQDQKKQEAEVQQSLDTIVADCEKKKLPAEEEIACIEEGYLRAMGETPPDDPR